MSDQSDGATQLISRAEVKQQLAIDESLTVHDTRIDRLIGAAIDWAQNYTQRSLGELIELPGTDSTAPLPDPKDSPSLAWYGNAYCIDGWEAWSPLQWREYWASNPIMQDQSYPLRRDAKEAMLLMIEILFDRNPDNMDAFGKLAENMLNPYRIAMGV